MEKQGERYVNRTLRNLIAMERLAGARVAAGLRSASRPVHAFLLRFSCVIAQLCYAMTIFSKMRFTYRSRDRC